MTVLPTSTMATSQHNLPYATSTPYGYGNSYGYGYNESEEDGRTGEPYRPPSGPPPPRFPRPHPSRGAASASAAAGPPPPAYHRILNRVSLRPVILFTTFMSFLYLLFIAITLLREISQEAETSRLKVFDAVIGALLLGAAPVEILGFVSAWTTRIRWAKLYSRASTIALGLVVGAEVVGIVEHYVAKSDIIDGCTTRNTGATSVSDTSWSIWGATSDSTGTPLTQTEAREYCQDRWNKEGIWVIVWLIVVLILGCLCVLLAFSFLRQLRDPSVIHSTRRNAAQGAAYSSAFNYDEDETSPFDQTGPDRRGGPYAYPPPPASALPSRGAAGGVSDGGFSASSSDAPEYTPRDNDSGERGTPRKSMTSIDLDRKVSLDGPTRDGNYEYEYEYQEGYTLDYGGGGEGGRGRPESSRSIRRVGEGGAAAADGEEGRRSDETLRGEEDQEDQSGAKV